MRECSVSLSQTHYHSADFFGFCYLISGEHWSRVVGIACVIAGAVLQDGQWMRSEQQFSNLGLLQKEY